MIIKLIRIRTQYIATVLTDRPSPQEPNKQTTKFKMKLKTMSSFQSNEYDNE